MIRGTWARAHLVAIEVSALCLVLGGCASNNPAPVVDHAPSIAANKAFGKSAKASDWRPQTYTVQKGDTLYGISLEHGFDYKELAEWNAIQAPYVIKIGQQLKLVPPQSPQTTPTQQPQTAQVVATPLKSAAAVEVSESGDAMLKTEPKAVKRPYSEKALETAPAQAPASAAAAQAVNPASVAVAAAQAAKPAPAAKPAEEKAGPGAEDDDKLDWSWPTHGKVVGEFSDASSAKGVDISGKSGQPVQAAAAGKVVYSGSGLRGYGKLIIIKHNKTYLSAYAHNSQILVKEGQSITKGQKIAEMGDSDADRVALHFEIRRFGKPVDPMKFLPSDSSAGN